MYNSANPRKNNLMQYANFTQNDKMPLLGFGTFKLGTSKSGDRQTYHVVREAIKLGYRHFDCAHFYGNESEAGEALSEAIAVGDVHRDELWITSKLWNNAHIQADVLPALQKSLEDLQLDYLDLYLIHWPVAFRPEISFPTQGSHFMSLDEIPIIETWTAMEELVDKGLVRHLGVSNFNVPKLQLLLAQCRIRPESNQVESHPFLQQQALVDFCQQEKITLTAFSPLGSSDRPARLVKENDPILLETPALKKMAKARQCSTAQLVLAWQMQRGVSVIPKSANPQRQKQNLESADIQLTRNEMNQISELERGFRFVDGSVWCIEGSPYSVKSIWDEA